MQELDETNVFVKYLPPDINDVSLKELFSPFGEIVSVKVMVDPPTGASLGYGYVLHFLLFFVVVFVLLVSLHHI